ncbi:MAG TPA: 50S ribosomal protein L11 methyltransferase [bacterium]
MTETPATFWTLDADLAPQSEELWSLFCYEHGATGAQWLEEEPERVRMRYTFDVRDLAADGWVAAFQAQYPDVAPPTSLAWQEQAVQPWATQWREHFRPLPIGQRLLICPPWDKGEATPEFAGRLRVVIDPGMGFGTGQHASTALALELIEQVMATQPPASVLDVGTGSGILAAAACLLGVRAARCIDIDERCVPEVRNNFALSGITVAPDVAVGGPAMVQERYPLVLANLTAPTLLSCGADLARLTLPGGHLILSGILTTEYPDVEAHVQALGLVTAAIRHRDAWTGLLMQRPR